MVTLYISPECKVCEGVEPKAKALAERYSLQLETISVPISDFPNIQLRPGWTFGVPTAVYKAQIYVGVHFLHRLEQDLQDERDGVVSLDAPQAESRASSIPYDQVI